jgi:hypothetical protein
VPHISISDDSHHVTEAIGSYYGDSPTEENMKHDNRPLSFIRSPDEKYDTPAKRNASYFESNSSSPSRVPLGTRESNERVVTSPREGSGKANNLSRSGSIGAENYNGQPSPPPFNRQQSDGDTAQQHFPVNDIDYESSPAAVAQEMFNLQAIRRMSMNVDTADPDLPSFPTVAPGHSADEDDPSKLFWVPARLHPELAPKEFKTFVEDRVERVRRTSVSDEGLSPDGLDRSGSNASIGLRRKKSMLSRQVNSRDEYRDGAERLERKRSRQEHGQPKLSELEEMPEDAAQLIQRLSLDTERRSHDSGVEIMNKDDVPILPPGGPMLKRSTHTTYRRGAPRRGERVPYSKRAHPRKSDDHDEPPLPSPTTQTAEEPTVGLTRVSTEPTSPSRSSHEHEQTRPVPRRGQSSHESDSSNRYGGIDMQQDRTPAPPMPTVPAQHQRQPERQPERKAERRPSDTPPTSQVRPRPSLDDEPEGQRHPQAPQQKQFQSRIAAPGRTSANLPGYKNANPLPNIVETLPDGTKVPVGSQSFQQPKQQQAQQHQQQTPQKQSPQVQQQPQQKQQTQPSSPSQNNFPERKSSQSQDGQRQQRGGAHMRPAPGPQQRTPTSSTLDDLSSHPSPLPGSGATRTDALTMVPTFEEKKIEKKEGGRKSSWKWMLGGDHDDDKEKKHAKDDKKAPEDKGAKLTKPQDKTRMDLLQTSIDGTNPVRGRESIVLSRDDIKLEDERKKESKKASAKSKTGKEEKEPGLLSAIFGGGKKKTSDTDLKAKKHKHERSLTPEPPVRILKPDIDYNWTRFSILEERAIYRMAHIKLANPKRALYSQVLLSNFMYSYLAKVQMMHPQMQIPASPQQKAAQQRKKEQEEQRAREKAAQPAEYSEYQKWQEVSTRHDPNFEDTTSNDHQLLQVGSKEADAKRQEGGPQPKQQPQSPNPNHASAGASRSTQDHDHSDRRSSSPEDDSASANEWPDYRSLGSSYNQQSQPSGAKPNMNGAKGYSVASTHDYLGYGSSGGQQQQTKGYQQELWDDDKEGDLW